MALGLMLAIAHDQVLAAAPNSLPKSQEELKTRLTNWFLSHGQLGATALLVLVVALVFLSQAQNIEAAKRLLGLELKPEPRQLLDDFRPFSAPLPPPASPLDPRLVPSGTGWLSNLPPPREAFVARQLELQQLEADLAPEGARVVIHGLPGVGKTTLALHYAQGSRSTYPGGVWWLDASQGFAPMALNEATELEARIPGLGTGQGLELEARLRRCFQAWPGEEGDAVLLVVDNLPAPPEGLEVMRRLTAGLPVRFRLLLTQRAAADGTGNLKLPVLASEEAMELFKTRSGEKGRQRIAQEVGEARALVEEVGRLPLALVLLGGRLRRLPTLTVSELRKELALSALEAKAFSEANAAFLDERGLVETLLGSWHTLGPESIELTKLLSLTLPGPISWELIQRCIPPAIHSPADWDWQDAVAELVGANLLEPLVGERVLFALHPLLREFFAIQWRVRERQPRWWDLFSKQRRGWKREPQWRRQLAVAANTLANQWKEKDLSIAVEYWRQATHAEPAEIWAAFCLGYGLIPLGDSEGARQAFEQARRNAEAANDPRGLSSALNGIGDVLVAQGDGPGALGAYQAGLTIAENLAQRDPANRELQRNVSVINHKIGDFLVTQEDSPGALNFFKANLAISEDLANRDPENMQWQSDLLGSKISIGNMLLSQGDGPRALVAYQAALTIAEGLAKRDPANTEWQRGLFVSKVKMGDVLVAQGGDPGALAAYQAGLTIAEDLAKRDPANTQWQRDLSVSNYKIGNVLVSQGDGPGALAAYQAGLAIAEGLAKRDPANTQWQRDLLLSHAKIGDLLVSQGDGPGALAAFQAGLTIAENLAKRDPANTQWQRGLWVSKICIGHVLESQGDGPGALAAYQVALTIAEDLAKRDPAKTEWQRNLWWSKASIGNVLESQGDGPGALAAYQVSLTIAEDRAKRDPANTEWQRDLSISQERIGDVLMCQGDGPGALVAYQAALTIREGLVKRDPANTQWQHGLLASKIKTGDVLVAQGDGPGALAAYQAGLTIADGLAKRDPANTEWQRDLLVSKTKMGDVLVSQGDSTGALAAYQAGLTIAEDLAKRDPSNALWQVDLAEVCLALGSLGSVLSDTSRRAHLVRGRDILSALRDSNRLHPSNLDIMNKLEEQIRTIDSGR